jgi:hypothetical protein
MMPITISSSTNVNAAFFIAVTLGEKLIGNPGCTSGAPSTA